METEFEAANVHGNPEHPQYVLDIEGREIPWASPTITVEEIAALGGWAVSEGVIEVDKDNNEHTLTPGEVVHLKPGHGFAKKVKWKRGDNLYEQRLAAELAILQSHFGDVELLGGWFRIANYPTLVPGWSRSETAVAIQAQVGYPGTPPYGIYVPVGLRFNGLLPASYQEPASNRPPFAGDWGVFSWAPQDGCWRATSDLHSGTNLLNFAIGIAIRFREGA